MGYSFDEEEARRLYEAGLSDIGIGKELCVSASAVQRWRARNGIAKQDRVAIDEKRARELYEAKWSDGKIAAELGTRREVIQYWRRKNGLAANGTRGGAREHSRGTRPVGFDEGTAMRLYKLGRSDREISMRLGVSGYMIEQWRKRNGLESNYRVTRADKPFSERKRKQKCYTCRYGSVVENRGVACLYILFTGSRRPCPAGEACTEYRRYGGRMKR